MTLDEIVFDMKGGHFSPGQTYVACRRVKSLQGLYINNFDLSAIRKSVKVEAEIERLASKLTLPIPKLFLHIYSLTIALLNIRSITCKLQDVKNDSVLQAADILCFCETWLNTSDPSPSVKDNHNVLRADRINSRGGGVMISIPHDTHILQNSGNHSNGIEHITITFKWYDIPCLLLLIYRLPLIPLSELLSILSDYTASILQCTSVIILGELNEDVLCKQNSSLNQFMTIQGFSQIVNSPTTDRGTLIDLVFIKNIPLTAVTINFSDTYYSDHDTIYCSLK